MERGWTGGGSTRFDAAELERAVFERVFGYLAVPGVPQFTDDSQMTDAVIDHIREAWRPQEVRIWRRRNAAQEFAVEATICTGPNSGYGRSGPTRGIAVCRAALFLAANRAKRWSWEPPEW